MPIEIKNPFTALKYRSFAMFWGGNLVSSCGVWVQNLAQGWLILRLSDSPFYLGLAGFAALFPTLLFALLGGTMADRFDRRRILMATQTLFMLLSFSLGLLTSLGVVTPWQILLVILLSGIVLALNSPAYQSVIPDLVPPEALSRAIALNSAQFNLARIIGHSLAGLAVAFIGEAGCFYLNALTYLPFLLALMLISLPPGRLTRHGKSIRRQLSEGLKDVAGNRLKLYLVLIVGCISLLGLPYFFLLPVFARDVLHRGPIGLGYLTAAVSVGALAAAFLMPTVASLFGRSRTVVVAGVAFWLVLLAFSFSRSYWLSFSLLILLGFSLVLVVATVNNILQVITPSEFRGRVMGINGMALNGLAPVGALCAGALAQTTSAPVAVGLLSGAGLVVAAGLGSRLIQIKGSWPEARIGRPSGT
jgi:MFS family permease